jgi:CubicO group peptidase (beta-lactamase class C family)
VVEHWTARDYDSCAQEDEVMTESMVEFLAMEHIRAGARRLLYVVVLALLVACGARSAPRPLVLPPASNQPVSRSGLGRALSDSLAALSTTGCPTSTLVALNDTIVLNQGFGAIQGESPYQESADSKHWLASVTKQFTAAAILRLQESGRLSVADTIGVFLSGVPLDKRAITIHQLLTHTSGLPQSYAADGVRDRSEAVRRILELPLDHAPGTTFLYSDDNYTLAATIVEIASGVSYEAYLRTHLFTPAHMTSTGFWGSPEATAVAPTSKPIPPQQRGAHWGQRGSGGLFSTSGDLFRWVRALKSGDLLTADSRLRLFGQYVRTSAGMYGYGWFTSETPWKTPMLWTRGNEDWGPNAYIALYEREGLTVISLSHAFTSDNRPCSRLVPPIVERLFSARR